MMTSITKSHNYECCMCGDHGLPHQLFRCSVCHFRYQHRYCSNLYPKAETYRVCNWCLIQKDNVDDHDNLNITSYNNNNNNNNNSISSSPEDHTKTITYNNNKKINKKLINNNNNHQTGGPSPKWLQPTSPIKKPPESRSPSGRKRITASTGMGQAQQEEIIRSSSSSSSSSSSILRRTKSATDQAISSSNNYNIKKKNMSGDNKKYGNGNGNAINTETGGPTVIKHVFRNKVRRYKLLDQVSC